MRRTIRIAAISAVILVLAACSGSGSSDPVAPGPIIEDCNSTSYPIDGACVPFAERTDERAATPFFENGAPVELEVVLYRPPGSVGPLPTVMFNHGSTGNGSDPSLFGRTVIVKSIAKYFVDRGWMVAFPQRRGRGRSDGLYDEGFAPDRSGYSCDRAIALAGAYRALDDLDAAVDWLRQRSDVDTTNMLVAGVSRGGVLSVAHAARRPDVYRGSINFVGGWIAEGCGDFAAINRTLFVAAAAWAGTSAWLYGENDSFYSIAHSRSNFDAFTSAGGMGVFHVFRREPGLNGHFVINDLELWQATVDEYLETL